MYGGKSAFQNQLGQLIVGRKLTAFALFYFVFEGNFLVQAPGGLIFGRAISRRVFCVTSLVGGGLYMEGLIFGNLRQFQHGIQTWPHTSSFKSAFTRILNEILVNFLVSASNELRKVWEETEEENLVPVVKIVKGTGEDSGRGSVKFEEGFLPFTQAFPSLIGFL